jgi:hypothetical protein
MTNPETEETEIWTEEDYAAIDAVAPYEPGKGISFDEALERARKRTKAWMQAAEPTVISA